MNTFHSLLTLTALCAPLATPAAAQATEIAPDRYAVIVRHADSHPATPAAARRTLARIDAAALAACGAPSSGLREVTLAVRKSPCWRGAMDETIARIGDPLLSEAHRHWTRN